jgi:aspartyl protease family protein
MPGGSIVKQKKSKLFACLAVPGLMFISGFTYAVNVSVVGLFPGKAVLVVDNAPPKTYSVGAKISEGIKLSAVSASTATIEANGKRQTIAIGEHFNRGTSSGPAKVTMQADGAGHFTTGGQINGGAVRMLVDTGATMISMPASDAIRLGIDYKKGQPGMVNTANGTAPVYRVKLNTVKVGDIELNGVDALVQESGLPIILLGMSFLNRTEMRREGEQMTLTKRY